MSRKFRFNSENAKKLDGKFVMIIAIISAVILVISLVMSGLSKVEVGDLPDDVEETYKKLVINEVVTNNNGIYANENGDVSDYVEIYNGTKKTVNLFGYGLSDDNKTVKWSFPDVEIKSGEYLVVSLTGKSEDGLNANFKLSSSGGEQLILVNRNSKIIDAVETQPLTKGQALVRDANGDWYIANYGTPGFENSLKGQAEYFASISKDTEKLKSSLMEVESGDGIEAMEAKDIDLVINEVLVRNEGNVINKYGNLEGYIELKNTSNHSINLCNYTLSNSSSSPFKVTLPEVSLKAGEIYVLYQVEPYGDRTDCLGFTFSSKNGEIVLGKGGQITSLITYQGLANGKQIVRKVGTFTDGKSGYGYYQSAVASMGYDNTQEGIKEAGKKYISSITGLVISEVMPANKAYLIQNGGNYYDFIELYNNSIFEIDLKDYCLTTSDTELTMYTLPDVKLKAHSYYILMCSGNTNLSNSSYQHTNFKIGGTESIYLVKNTAKKKIICDAVFVSEVPAGYSYQRTDYGFEYVETPTPGAKNGSGKSFVSTSPIISQLGGVYNNGETFEVTGTGAGTLYYTLDGSTPTKDSKKYSGPITVKETVTVKLRNFEDGGVASPVTQTTFVMNENHTLPIVCVSLNSEDYTHILSKLGASITHQATIEYYDGDDGFRETCGFSLFGGNARYQKQKSYKLSFTQYYGSDGLAYKMFDNRDSVYYKSLVLRCGSTDQKDSIIRDILQTSLVDDGLDLDVQAYKPCIVYLNGKYFGIYNIREKIDENFVANHYNVEAENINVYRIDGDVTHGTKAKYNALKKFCTNNDLSIKENYDYVCTQIDIDKLCDYWLCQCYTTNNDLLNVRYFDSPDINDGKITPILYDFDYAWYNTWMPWYEIYVFKATACWPTTRQYENEIIKALMKSPYFKELWLTRMNYVLRNVLNETTVSNRIDEIKAIYAPEIDRSQTRWGRTVAHYEEKIEWLRNWGVVRTKGMLKDTKKSLNLTDAEMKKYFGDLWK